MNAIVLKTSSKENLDLLIALAKKLGVEVSVLNDTATEDLALGIAIKEGKTGETIDTEQFLNELRSGYSD